MPLRGLASGLAISLTVLLVCLNISTPSHSAGLDGKKGVYVRLDTVVGDKSVTKLLREISLADLRNNYRLNTEEVYGIGYAELTGTNLAGPRQEALTEAFEAAIRKEGIVFVHSDTEISDELLEYERTQIHAEAYFLPGFKVVWEGISKDRYKVVIRADLMLLEKNKGDVIDIQSSERIISENEEHILPLKKGWVIYRREGVPLEASNILQVGDNIHFTLPHGETLKVPSERVEVRKHLSSP